MWTLRFPCVSQLCATHLQSNYCFYSTKHDIFKQITYLIKLIQHMNPSNFYYLKVKLMSINETKRSCIEHWSGMFIFQTCINLKVQLVPLLSICHVPVCVWFSKERADILEQNSQFLYKLAWVVMENSWLTRKPN